MKHEAIQLYADGSRGIYVPQFFAQSIRRELVAGVRESIWDDLADPYADSYWEAWEEVLRNAVVSIDGQNFHLHQDGDLWLIDYDNADKKELENIIGEW